MFNGKDLLSKSCWQHNCSVIAKPEASFILDTSCSVIHRDEVFFYGAKELLFDIKEFKQEEIWIDLSFETQDDCNKTFAPSSGDSLFSESTCEVKLRNGLSGPNKIVKFECSKGYQVMENDLQFDFVKGVCESNNHNIMLCFPSGNTRLCYKSKHPNNKQWWEWFTYAPLSYNSHDKGFSFNKVFKFSTFSNF